MAALQTQAAETSTYALETARLTQMSTRRSQVASSVRALEGTLRDEANNGDETMRAYTHVIGDSDFAQMLFEACQQHFPGWKVSLKDESVNESKKWAISVTER